VSGRQRMKKKKIFYRWWIVFSAFLITAVGLGAINSTSGILVKPVCEELGISRAEFSTYRTFVTLVGTVLLPAYGRLINCIGIKKVMIFCTVGISSVTFMYSFSTELWHFYVIALINGLVLNGLSFMSVGILIRNWFIDKLGITTGLAYAGTGIGAAIMAPIVGWIVENMSWQAVFRIIGLIIFIILIPTIVFLVKEKPEDIGLESYTEKSKDEVTKDEIESFNGIMFQQAIKTPTFWLLVIPIFLLAILASAPNVHTVPYLSDIGYSTTYATSIVSLIMIMLTIARIILGIVYDKYGSLFGNLFLSFCCMAFPLLALIAKTPTIPFIYAAFYGMASSGASIPVAILVSNYFGSKDYSSIFSVFTMISTFGAAIGAPIMGAIFDITESYYLAWIMLFVFAIIILITLIATNKTSKNLKIN